MGRGREIFGNFASAFHGTQPPGRAWGCAALSERAEAAVVEGPPPRARKVLKASGAPSREGISVQNTVIFANIPNKNRWSVAPIPPRCGRPRRRRCRTACFPWQSIPHRKSYSTRRSAARCTRSVARSPAALRSRSLPLAHRPNTSVAHYLRSLSSAPCHGVQLKPVKHARYATKQPVLLGDQSPDSQAGARELLGDQSPDSKPGARRDSEAPLWVV